MKTKIYTLIAITLMIASAFVGIGAMASSNDVAAVTPGTGTINYLSTDVDYVPGVVNVTNGVTGSKVTFTPTVNWSNAPTGYTITSTSNIYTTCSDTGVCSGTYTGSGFNIDIDATKVTITGVEANTHVTLYITVTSVLSYNDGAATTIASRTTDPMSFTINVYSAPTLNNPTINNCYFGEEYKLDLNGLVSNGSGDYTFVITNTNLNNTGLYILGDSIMGTALYTAFANGPLSVDLKITDSKTGITVSKTISIPMIPTAMTVAINETIGTSSVHNTTTLTDGSTGYVDQGNVTTITITWTQDTTTPALVTNMKITDITTGEEIPGIGSGVAKSLPTDLIGTHEYIISYTINNYSASFTFNLEVIANGAFMITPHIDVTLTR